MTDPANANTDVPVRTILFVCTGNTCRSPMAEAIAEDLLRRSGSTGSHFVASAGVAAADGMGMTPDALDALDTLGIPTHPHRATSLSPEMVEKADVVFGLTGAHVQAIKQLAPEAPTRVATLDPEGEDVPDPIGKGPHVYHQTARRLHALIADRLRELGVSLDEGATT